MSATALKTYYVVQPFVRGKRGGLKAEQAIQVQSETAAILRGERLAESKAGVLVFSQTGDPEMGDFDEPVFLASHGDVPPRD
ncbi:hypothetical protein [Microvirga lenta]|uniref:hypothetical protein n=1 Tax=Microvirga lenta TaxID=2881337 RepID=UPI001CFD7985|nr:hypothetical protein [Microvirga lenta]MCB5173684.1 hypothetical protein [Microvirga lenta]